MSSLDYELKANASKCLTAICWCVASVLLTYVEGRSASFYYNFIRFIKSDLACNYIQQLFNIYVVKHHDKLQIIFLISLLHLPYTVYYTHIENK